MKDSPSDARSVPTEVPTEKAILRIVLIPDEEMSGSRPRRSVKFFSWFRGRFRRHSVGTTDAAPGATKESSS